MKSPWRSSLYAILDLPHAGGLAPLAAARALLRGGCGVLQLRAKRGFRDADFALWEELVELCRTKGVPLIINDDPALALQLADVTRQELPGGFDGGVGSHLGQADLLAFRARAQKRRASSEAQAEPPTDVEPSGYWGLSTHSLEQVAAAGRSGASYLGFGPVFATDTKANASEPVGIDGLKRACRSSLHPIVAIGGIDKDRAACCLDAGAAAVASISALVADTPVRIEAACGEMLAMMMMR